MELCRGCMRVSCRICTERVCPYCGRSSKRPEPVAKPPRPMKSVVLHFPIETKAVWDAIRPMGALRIEPHEDSGGYVAVFPYQLTGYVTAGELARAVFAAAPGAGPTPFGSGRWQKPEDAWYVTFTIS